MAENPEPLGKLPDASIDKKKRTRRGNRGGNKKANDVSIENYLTSAMQNVEIQPKRRQPRKPKPVPKQEKEEEEAEDEKLLKKENLETKNVNKVSIKTDVKIDDEISTSSDIQKPKRNRRKNREDFRTNDKTLKQNYESNVKPCYGVWSRVELPQTSNHSNDPNKNEKNKYSSYLIEKLARELLSANPGEFVEGNIRINPKFFKEAYIAMTGNESDLLIDGVQDRNRALEGDLVIVRINPKDKWRGAKSAKPQKTATVVCILEKIHPRKIVGFLKAMPDNNSQIALFSPRDHKVPRLNIDRSSWPPNFADNPDAFSNVMFLAEITTWNDVRFARGNILGRIGDVGDLKAESEAILLENDLDVTPYTTALTKDLPSSEYQPSAEDIEGREDWRKECVFTIDPMTARDLDDAMSCKPLENGNFEVGVHISDVTHYLKSDMALDRVVSKRATTIYLSDSVYHMLPKQLCNVCSLLPGSDKLAFSVIFEMTPAGEVVSHRFAKTVINSCCQFAYEHAQKMIEDPEKEWNKEDFPDIKGPYEISRLSMVVNNLNKLAVNMRESRLNNGSLRIDQPKLHVFVDSESGLPVSFTLEEQKDSNRLIEEFMLLANMTTATHLFRNLPDISLLRRHQEPLMRLLKETQTMLEKLGIHIDVDSAGALQASLLRYQPDPNTDSAEDVYLASSRSKVLNALCSKAMTRAKYFCTSAKMADQELRHYALNAPLYTHFTSPIRRYSDCIVHRLLHASITKALPVPNWTATHCARIAANCNKQKYNAKRAQEMSSELYLTAYIGSTGPVNSTAIVIDVKDRSFDVIVCSMGITLRIYSAEIEKVASVNHSKDDDVQTLTIAWKKSGAIQVINIFSITNIKVSKDRGNNRLHGELLEPEIISV